jgi:putative transposase
MVVEVMARHDLSQRRACGLLIGITRRGFRQAPTEDRNQALRQRLRELAEERQRWGCPLLYLVLRREGWQANHKRVERLYREEGLTLKRRRRRRKRLSHLRVLRERPVAPNQTWAVDFIHDSLRSGRRFRAFAVLDEWSRESLAIEVDVSLPGERVTRVLERLRETRGLPTIIQADNDPELRGQTLDQWAYDHGVCSLSTRASRSRTRTSRVSTPGCAKNALTNTSSFAQRCAAEDRTMANCIQLRTPPFQLGQPDAGRVRSVGRRARERSPRAHRSASTRNAGRRAAWRSGCGSKTPKFFGHPQSGAKGGLKNGDHEGAEYESKMNPKPGKY